MSDIMKKFRSTGKMPKGKDLDEVSKEICEGVVDRAKKEQARREAEQKLTTFYKILSDSSMISLEKQLNNLSHKVTSQGCNAHIISTQMVMGPSYTHILVTYVAITPV